jgi:hypothetical protein
MSDEFELPSDELRALYRRLQPSPLADDVAGADPETARVVRWMQGAWSGLTPPRTLVPSGLTRPRRSAWRAPRTRIAAAAAAVLLLAGAVLWRLLAGTGPSSAPERVAQVPPQGPAPTVEAVVELIDVRPDRIELRSGPVRLLLLDPSPEPSAEPPGS